MENKDLTKILIHKINRTVLRRHNHNTWYAPPLPIPTKEKREPRFAVLGIKWEYKIDVLKIIHNILIYPFYETKTFRQDGCQCSSFAISLRITKDKPNNRILSLNFELDEGNPIFRYMHWQCNQ